MLVEGVKGVIGMLRRTKSKYKDFDERNSVTVGCTQSYALFVHEDMEAAHEVGEAKFMQKAVTQTRNRVGSVITTALSRGAKALQAFLMGGYLIQRTSQDNTPVDTGALKASHFTCPTSELNTVANEKYRESEKIRRTTRSRHEGKGKR